MGKQKGHFYGGSVGDAPQIGVDHKQVVVADSSITPVDKTAPTTQPTPSPDQEAINSKFEDADKIMMHVANK